MHRLPKGPRRRRFADERPQWVESGHLRPLASTIATIIVPSKREKVTQISGQEIQQLLSMNRMARQPFPQSSS